MSQNPYEPAKSSSPPQPAPSNTIGLVGFIVSILSLFLTCGLLSPLGLLISFFGLFKAPRGMAIAGTLLGALGSVWLATMGFAMIATIMAAIGIGKAIVPMAETADAMNKARKVVEQYQTEKGKLPDGIEGNKLILDIKDGWKHSLQYEGDGGPSGKFVIRSAGPDGNFNTADDMTNEGINIDAPQIDNGMPGGSDDDTMPFQIPGGTPESAPEGTPENVPDDAPDAPEPTP